MGDQKTLEGEILEDGTDVPPVHDVTPGWIGRNRQTLEKGRNLTRVLMVAAPPPVRVPLAVASLAADALLIADDLQRRRDEPHLTSLRGGALVLEGAAMLAATRFAPARLVANLAGIEAARKVVARVIDRERTA
ncbi:MAG: hypothetical protein AAF409_01125 [Pseudomonadota bacterium]